MSESTSAKTPAKKVAKKSAPKKAAAKKTAAKKIAKKSAPKKAATKKADAATAADRSAAISASWGDKKVAAARSLKHKVKVGGVVYRSVLDAFQQLGLDVNKHIRFRAELKAEGTKTFEGKKFTLVEATA